MDIAFHPTVSVLKYVATRVRRNARTQRNAMNATQALGFFTDSDIILLSYKLIFLYWWGYHLFSCGPPLFIQSLSTMGECNVKVVVRFRPFNEREKLENVDSDLSVDFPDESTVQVLQGGKLKNTFMLDRVLTPTVTQVIILFSFFFAFFFLLSFVF